MRKFAVFSGFLGSGKTTTMIALTQYYSQKYQKAAMISNDLGRGVDLADHLLARFQGANASEITGECICFCHDVLTARLDSCFADGCELVVSDIPGFGVGALEHVYHGLNGEYPGQYELAPFTVLTEPGTVGILRSGADADLTHILHAQLMEADLIVLNKCDQISEEQKEADKAWLAGRYPQARVIAISALQKEGLDELCLALREGSASLRHPDINYEEEGLQNEMGSLSESYLQYRAVVCCNDFDGTAYLREIAGQVQKEFQNSRREIPHLKLLAWEPEGDFGKVDLLGAGKPIETTRPFERRCTELAVVLDANAACPAEELERILSAAVRAVSDAYQLELYIFKTDCFGMGG